MQTLFKNLFNSINLLRISLLVIFIKIFRKPSVKSTLRYRKINFFIKSALLKCIFWLWIFKPLHKVEDLFIQYRVDSIRCDFTQGLKNEVPLMH
jgi:hypothetical protein